MKFYYWNEYIKIFSEGYSTMTLIEKKLLVHKIEIKKLENKLRKKVKL